jgi:phosphopantetheinyl transferase
MEELSIESKARIARFYMHRDRCRHIADKLGKVAGHNFHLRHKADPGSAVAEKEYQRLMVGN